MAVKGEDVLQRLDDLGGTPEERLVLGSGVEVGPEGIEDVELDKVLNGMTPDGLIVRTTWADHAPNHSHN